MVTFSPRKGDRCMMFASGTHTHTHKHTHDPVAGMRVVSQRVATGLSRLVLQSL